MLFRSRRERQHGDRPWLGRCDHHWLLRFGVGVLNRVIAALQALLLHRITDLQDLGIDLVFGKIEERDLKLGRQQRRQFLVADDVVNERDVDVNTGR